MTFQSATIPLRINSIQKKKIFTFTFSGELTEH